MKARIAVATVFLCAFLSACYQPVENARMVKIDGEAPVTYSFRVDPAAGGTVSVAEEKEAYAPGEMVRVLATPDPGYRFIEFKGTSRGAENPWVIEIQKDEWLIPVFSPVETAPPDPLPETFTVLVDSAAGGTAVVTPSREAYAAGEQVKLEAIPGEGYSFAGWGGTETGTVNPMVIAVSGNEWIIPRYALDTPEPLPTEWTLRVDQDRNGTVTVDPSKAAYADGEYVKVTAAPAPGYLFAGWTGTVTGNQNPMVLRMDGDEWLVPKFEAEPLYQVIIDRNPVGGTVSVSPDKTGDYRYGERCTLTATPSPGYRFDGWSGDFSGTQPSVFIVFDRDYQVMANFSAIPAEITYALELGAPAHGTLVATPLKDAYYAGETVRVTAVPSAGYLLESWSGAPNPARDLSIDVTMDANKAVSANFSPRAWTHLVYMAADNNLDSQSVNDINEMESADFGGARMSVLALVDRKAGNGDWSDTRLYEILPDPDGNAAQIVSRRLDSVELGLSANVSSELDTSDPVTLGRFLSFAERAYGAARYSLTVWGHGTGWRGEGSPVSDGTVPMKAVALDDTSGSYLPIGDLGAALSGSGLSVVGFDTCFGALLEIGYELRGAASYLVASEGPTRETGWDYSALFSSAGALGTPLEFTGAIRDQFQDSYADTGNATISIVDLGRVGNLHAAFNAWAGALGGFVGSAELRNELLAGMFDPSRVDAFWFAGQPSDYYLDIGSFAEFASTLPGGSALASRRAALESALAAAVVSTWSAEYGPERRHIGVFAIGVSADTVPLAAHSPAYVRGSGFESGAFVHDTPGWVPSVTASENSALNRLFYQALP